MSHIIVPCLFSVKIDYLLDSDSKYHEDQEKKGLQILKSLYLCKYKQKQTDIAVKLRLTLFWLIVFFLF